MKFDVWNLWDLTRYNITFTLFEFKYLRRWKKKLSF